MFEGNNGVVAGVMNRSTTGYGGTNSVTAPLLQGGYFSNGQVVSIHLMQGVVPTDLSTLTSYSVRSADILVSWYNFNYGNSNNLSAFHINISSYTTPCIISSSYVAATASGTATWFWWTVRNIPSSGNMTGGTTLHHQIVGTVGTTGSGADLELPDVNITSGENYRFLNLRIDFSGPDFTY